MTGKQIKTLRKACGLTQVEFADKMRVSFATVNRWERGHCGPLPDRLERMKQMKNQDAIKNQLEKIMYWTTPEGSTVSSEFALRNISELVEETVKMLEE